MMDCGEETGVQGASCEYGRGEHTVSQGPCGPSPGYYASVSTSQDDNGKSTHSVEPMDIGIESSQGQQYPHCSKLGISLSTLENPSTWKESKLTKDRFTKGLVKEVVQHYAKKQESVNNFKSFTTTIFDLNASDPKKLWLKAKRTRDCIVKLVKARKFTDMDLLEDEVFEMPGEKSQSTTKDTQDGEPQHNSTTMKAQTSSTVENVGNLWEEKREVLKENQRLREALKRKDDSSSIQGLERAKEELSSVKRSRRHYQKKSDEKTAKINQLQESLQTTKDQLHEKEIQRQATQQQLDISRQTAHQLQAETQQRVHRLETKVTYYKQKTMESHQVNMYRRKVEALKEDLDFWQTKCAQYEEQLEQFVEQREIAAFEDGRYTDTVREVYMDLMCMQVGAKNVEKIVRTVLQKMAGIQIGRLPQETFAKYMILEARSLALTHMKEELERSNNVTVGIDGTTKFGHHYGGAEISFEDRGSMVIGMRDMAGGEAQAYLDTLKKMVEEVAAIGGGDKEKNMNIIASKMKNTITDQASTNKKMNELISTWRSEALPQAIEDWDNLADNEKTSMLRMNNFWCGLHFLVGLSEQANKTLSVWENLMHHNAVVGAPSLPGGYAKSGEAGTTRLVRTTCKAIQDKGCEKAGKPVEFRDYLATEGKRQRVPLAPFKGNRFNILFYNSAGVYYLWEDLENFFRRHKEDNRLFSAVAADIDLLTYKAGARALGLVCKMVTEPLWRELELDGHVSAVTSKYQAMHQRFEQWSEDATTLLRGEGEVFPAAKINKDGIYRSLVEPQENLDAVTKQILELMMTSFVLVCNRQLKDHIGDGKYANWTEEMKETTKSVPRTNVGPERIFGELDRLLRIMPSATTIAIEGITMWTHNHTADWVAQLTAEEKAEVMENARKSVKNQRAQYLQQRSDIRQIRRLKQAQKLEAQEQKSRKDRVRKEELTTLIKKYDGLWKTGEEVDQHLKKISKQQQRTALEVQLKFRRHVLDMKNSHGILNFTSGGKKLPQDTLLANLKCAIRISEEEAEQVLNEDLQQMEIAPLTEEELQHQKQEFQNLIAKEKQRQQVQKIQHKRQRKTKGDVSDPEDLIGKMVTHLCEEDEGEMWFTGLVTGITRRGKKPTFTIKYNISDKVYHFPLLEDLKEGDLRILDISGEDLVGKRVDHRFRSDNDGKDYWYTGTVLAFNKATKLHAIQYDYEEEDNPDDEDEAENNIFEEPLLQDYLSHDVRILQ